MVKSKMDILISSATSEPGVFYAQMSFSAAHRAIHLSKRPDLLVKGRVQHEPDFYILKAEAIEKINQKLQDPAQAIGDAAFDIVISLTNSAVCDLVSLHLLCREATSIQVFFLTLIYCAASIRSLW